MEGHPLNIQQLLIDDPAAKHHAAALTAYERNRSVSFDQYLSAVSFFFSIDIHRGVQCPMYDVLNFTLRDLYDQETLPNFARLGERTSVDSSITSIST
jgi:hypothetical protein